MEHKYRIAVKGRDTSFELESTDREWLEKKEKEYLEKFGASQQAAFAPMTKDEAIALPQNLTINEYYKKYIKANNITARPDIAVFFVYYMQKILKRDALKTGDISQCFADVSYPNYNKLNFTDILNQARKKALLNSVNNLWTLTITGEDFVLNLMTGAGK